MSNLKSKCECCGRLVQSIAVFLSRVTASRVYICGACLQQLLDDVTTQERVAAGKQP